MQKILVIDDTPEIIEELVAWLTFENYHVISAEDGVKGLQAAFQNLPDLILCDVNMPLLDGYGVLRELRTNPKTALTPFIFVSADSALDDVEFRTLIGSNGYVRKPFARRDLFDAIQSSLPGAAT